MCKLSNLPRLVELLTSGGDDRICILPASGLNIYGYGAVPRPSELSFSSSTASNVEPETFEALSANLQSFSEAIARRGETAVYDAEMSALKQRMRTVLELGPELKDIVLAASGTDIHLITAALMRAKDSCLLQTITLTGSETGSGVEMAAGGRHFASTAPAGTLVMKGAKLSHDDPTTNINLQVRGDDGSLLPDDEIESTLEELLAAAHQKGGRCLLTVADISKTGIIAPSLETVLRLKRRWPGTLDIMIDACQFRLSPGTIRAYLQQDFLVAVTGSKFMSGPIFSGALLVPPDIANRLKSVPLPSEFDSYCSRFEWPEDWAARKSLPARANFGLLLRWQGALLQMSQLLAIPDHRLKLATLEFERAVSTHLEQDAVFEIVPGRPIDRSVLPDAPNESWDDTQTIFGFYLRDPVTGEPFNIERTLKVYQRLAQSGVRLGQPVACAKDRIALRLCLSAPLLSKFCSDEAAAGGIVRDAKAALDRTAMITRDLCQPDFQTAGGRMSAISSLG